MASSLSEGELQAAEGEVAGLTKSAWDQDKIKPRFPSLEGTEVAEVVVIGGGIAGLSCAYNLLKHGKSVVLLEARAIGSGQTGRTTAHLMPWNDDYYYIIESLFSHQKAYIVGDSHRKSIDWIEDVVRRENIDCKFQRIDGLLFATDTSSDTLSKLNKEYEASKRCGFDNIVMVDLKGDPSYGSVHQAIKWPNSAHFHPLMYLNGLADAVTRLGGKIYEQSLFYTQEGTTVKTKDGKGTVEAQHVVLATNSPINHNLAVHARQSPDRSYAIGLKVNKGDIKDVEWWGTDTPYHYIRLEHKEDFDVLIVGGEDHPIGLRPSQYADNWKRLEDWTRPRWPAAQEVLYKWSGMVYEPVDVLGLYGKNPGDSNNTYIITGDSGEGMTGGTIGGIVVTDIILGRPNPWIDVYSPSRIPPPSLQVGQSMGTMVSHTVQGYKDVAPGLGSDHIDIEDLAPCSGAVINEGLQKVAVYKDSSSHVHRYSAICPHLKCVVKWNPNEGTFDCPCHGSQFNRFGRLMQGPAKSDLKNLTPTPSPPP